MTDARIALRARNGAIRAYVVVDAADLEPMQRWSWCLHGSGSAIARVGGRLELMHRVIMGLGAGDPREVDHRDGDRLNNRRRNLRLATRKQNAQNQPAIVGTSRYRGVSWSKQKRKWRARAKLDGREIHLGFFHDEEEAAEAARRFRAEHMPFSVER